MPNYEVECRLHGRYQHQAPIAEGPRKTCPSCQGPVKTVLHAVPIHGVGGTAARRTWASGREKDIAAYKRLRKDGVQPKGINGSAEIETRAGERHEVEMDRVYVDRSMAKRVTHGLQEVGDPRA